MKSGLGFKRTYNRHNGKKSIITFNKNSMRLLVSVPYKSTSPFKNCSALIFLIPDFEKSRVSKLNIILG